MHFCSSLCAVPCGFKSPPRPAFAVTIYLLYLQLGVSAFVAVFLLLLMIPANILLMRTSAGLLKQALTHTDERTKLEGELVGGGSVLIV